MDRPLRKAAFHPVRTICRTTPGASRAGPFLFISSGGSFMARFDVAVHSFSSSVAVVALFLAVAALLNNQFAMAQASVGVQKFGAYDGAPDTIDLGTLGVHLEIPLYHKAGRGNGTGIDITLNNSGSWPAQYVLDSTGRIVHYLGLGTQVSFGMTELGTYSHVSSTHLCVNIPNTPTYTDYYWTYVDARGNRHLFPGN